MRMLENFLLNSIVGLAVAIVLLVIGFLLKARGVTILLVFAWILLAISLFRSRPFSAQILIPRILLTSLILSGLGLGFYLLVGWRPVLSRYTLKLVTFTEDLDRPDGTM